MCSGFRLRIPSAVGGRKGSTVAKKTKRPRKTKRAKTNLAGMSFEALMELRDQVEDTLSGMRGTLEKQLASIGGSIASFATGRGPSKMKGRKVAAKYKGPAGELWAGRGATPRWLVAAIKETGKKREDFLIDKGVGGTKTRRATKK
jgi:DNA-binding protein H-NS